MGSVSGAFIKAEKTNLTLRIVKAFKLSHIGLNQLSSKNLFGKPLLEPHFAPVFLGSQINV